MALQTHRQVIFCPPLEELYFDEACLTVKNALNTTINLYRLYDVCRKCDFEFWTSVPPLSVVALLVPIFTVMSFKYTDEAETTTSCVVTYHYQQHGMYRYMADLSCDFVHVINLPDYPYTSFFILVVCITTLWVIVMMLSYLRLKERLLDVVNRLLQRKSRRELDLPETPEMIASQVFQKAVYNKDTNQEHVVEYKSRGINTVQNVDELLSIPSSANKTTLDFVEFEALLAMRGLVAMAWVCLLVDYNTFPIFTRSAWDGLTLDDIKAGWLYWVLASSFYLRINYNLRKYGSRKRLLYRTVLLRSLLYYLGGFCYNSINNTRDQWTKPLSEFVNIKHSRAFGTFQRVSLAYLITGSAEACFVKREIKVESCLQDIKDSWPQWLVALVLLTVHTCLTYLLPVPGCPTGYVGPGGRQDNGNYSKCTGGAARYIDSFVLGPENMVDPETSWSEFDVYNIRTSFEPQGLLGTLTTSCLMALAMQAARIFIYFEEPQRRLYRLINAAWWQLMFGGFLCSFQTHGGLVPINPYLMSASYVLVVSGLAYVTLALLYLLISVLRFWNGLPLIYTGINMLVVIVGIQFFSDSLPFVWDIPPERMYTGNESLFRDCWAVFLWTVCCYYMLIHRFIFPI